MKRRYLAGVLLSLLLAASVAAAQGRSALPTWNRYARFDDFDGSFQFCRLMFRNAGNGDGAGWNVDWPRADQNLSIRISELTRTPVSMDSDAETTPRSLVVTGSSPEISHCPFVMMTEPGAVYWDSAEIAGLRNYLLKGGFLWADDFWGDYAWDFWANQIRQVLPSGEYPIKDVPTTSPLFHELMTVAKFPQIPGIGYWAQTGGSSERGAATAEAHLRAIYDKTGRIMVLMTHNTDFGDAYEREGDNHDYFERFSVPGYAFGVNVVLYSMTH